MGLDGLPEDSKECALERIRHQPRQQATKENSFDAILRVAYNGCLLAGIRTIRAIQLKAGHCPHKPPETIPWSPTYLA